MGESSDGRANVDPGRDSVRVCADAGAVADWCVEVLGLDERERWPDDDGVVRNVELIAGNSEVWLDGPYPTGRTGRVAAASGSAFWLTMWTLSTSEFPLRELTSIRHALGIMVFVRSPSRTLKATAGGLYSASIERGCGGHIHCLRPHEPIFGLSPVPANPFHFRTTRPLPCVSPRLRFAAQIERHITTSESATAVRVIGASGSGPSPASGTAFER